MSNLEQTQPGDQVIVTAYYSRSPSAVVQTVERVTKSQVVTEDGNRFARRTGIRVGSSGSISPLIAHPRGEERAESLLLECAERDQRARDSHALELVAERIRRKTHCTAGEIARAQEILCRLSESASPS